MTLFESSLEDVLKNPTIFSLSIYMVVVSVYGVSVVDLLWLELLSLVDRWVHIGESGSRVKL